MAATLRKCSTDLSSYVSSPIRGLDTYGLQDAATVLQGAAIVAASAAALDGPLPVGEIVGTGIMVGAVLYIGAVAVGDLWNWIWEPAPVSIPKAKPIPRTIPIPPPPLPCPPCPDPPSPYSRLDKVPPSAKHFPCPCDHEHFYVPEYNQNPKTCECFLKNKEVAVICR